MMTDQEWQDAERREPGRTYLDQGDRSSRRQERAAYAIFFAGALTIWGFMYCSMPAFAEGGWSSSQMSSRDGDRGGGGMCCSESPRKTENSSQRGHDPFNEPDIGKSGDGMTGGDAYY